MAPVECQTHIEPFMTSILRNDRQMISIELRIYSDCRNSFGACLFCLETVPFYMFQQEDQTVHDIKWRLRMKADCCHHQLDDRTLE